MDTVLQIGPHKGRADGDNHLPVLSSHPTFDIAQDAIGLLGCTYTQLAHIELFLC